MKLLVAYASPHGSTAEIAVFMGRVLDTYDVDVTVMHADEVEDVGGYDAFLLGSAVHSSMWLPSLSRLMFRFEDELAQKLVYLFLTCIIVLEEGGYEKALTDYVWGEALDKLNIPVANVKPLAGKLDWSRTSGDEKWMMTVNYEGKQLPGRAKGDYRDWQEIAKWIHSVANDLELPLALSQQAIAKDETITQEEVDQLSWPDNPGETGSL